MSGAFQWVYRWCSGLSWFLPPVVVSAACNGVFVLSWSSIGSLRLCIDLILPGCQDIFDALVARAGRIRKCSMPSLFTNSLMRSKPASEDKSPPSKFILIFLLLSRAKVFTILIRAPLLVFILIRHLNFTTNECPFSIHLTSETQYQLKYSNYVVLDTFTALSWII